MKALLLIAFGAIGYHLWANAEDRNKLAYEVRSGITAGADAVADTARPNIIDTVKNR